ncbi:YbdK family carboxylate-amine ligase [Azoarcus sp. KH32C]|uniref:YbdK family carboxylate-amine ligase n=1 Tax=Azoarcus sp. KH32C TaxID=748247 RepID=UPI000238656C|nr:YbdK family carboxylate-amine ligase [Azoarcus sp. KH32C]BAL26337.1 carboxylate-amine ligase [Azoarcus sp. KH32C]
MMALEAFGQSRPLTLGVELELQIVNTHDYDLVGGAEDLLRTLAKRELPGDVKPEITDSMIEVSTGICEHYADVSEQLTAIRDALVEAAGKFNVGICGGGTHAFQHWGERRIFDAPRFHHLSELYGYLAKQFTVFGQHVHIGCPGPDVALYLLHSLSRYLPHFIALSASSPFVQGSDTGFQSARLNSVFAFPLSGRAPFVESWADFETFFDKMTATGVVESMKDFYWDIRPKPEFGTIEVRVMDTPLTVRRAAQLAAYIQSVARYLLVERPLRPAEDDYLVYTFNRFEACRFGLAGTFVDPRTHEHRSIAEDILATMDRIEQHAIELKADVPCRELREMVAFGRNDAESLRADFAETRSLNDMVRLQCLRWKT